MPHAEGEGELEESGMMFPIGYEFAKVGEEACGFFLGDLEAADTYAFTIVNKMRGGEESAAEGQPLSKCVDHGAGRSLAVGPGNVDDFGSVGGKGEEFAQQASRAFEPELNAKRLGGVEPIESFLIVHGVNIKIRPGCSTSR